MSPGDDRSGGSGLVIDHGFHDSPFGEFLLACTERGVCWLSFVGPESRERNLEALRAEWPAARLRERPDRTLPTAQRIFPLPEGSPRKPLYLHVKGSNLQLKVWEALLRIPPGAALSYGDVARQIGRPRAARAVGTAVGGNPVSWLIPCHRVIRANGIAGDYRWGRARKLAMLAWESSRG